MTKTATANKSFAEFLQAPAKRSKFVLDLRNASMREVIEAMVEVKLKNHHNYDKRFTPLLGHITAIEMMSHTVLQPEQVTDVFWVYFQDYLENERHLKASSINDICGKLHLALQWGSLHNATVSRTYDILEKKTEEIVRIALSPAEIARIYYFDPMTIPGWRIDHLKKLMRVRDMLVLSCCLGQRYSDMVRITPDCFSEGLFKIKQLKTQNTAVVDIRRFAFDTKICREILERYKYHAPYKSDISNYNKYLKELLKYIGMNDGIKIERKVNGKMQTVSMETWEKVASHIGRRTFATLATLRNLPRYEIMRATGHTTEKAFVKYIVLGD